MAPVNWFQKSSRASEVSMAKVSSCLGPQVAVGAQQHAGLLLRLHQVVVIDGQGGVIHAVVRAPQILK